MKLKTKELDLNLSIPMNEHAQQKPLNVITLQIFFFWGLLSKHSRFILSQK
jgi:hypothetical protein